MSDLHRIASNWLLGGDTGASSKCMLRALLGLPGRPDVPHDSGDFGRVYRLWAQLGVYQADALEAVAKAHPLEWGSLVGRWADLVALYRAGDSAGVYEVLRSINWACRACGSVGGSGRQSCPRCCGRMLCRECYTNTHAICCADCRPGGFVSSWAVTVRPEDCESPA